MTHAAVVGSLIFVPMLFEAARSARNERGQRRRGGVEPDGDVYNVMRIAYPTVFLAMIVEGTLCGWPPPLATAAGGGVFAAAKALKWWAIFTLGPAWTFRVIVVPGTTRVASGPYRFMRHPNYVAVAGELCGAAFMTGALVSGPAAVLGFGALILRRIAIEQRALDAILRRD
jgi:methyltransferase